MRVLVINLGWEQEPLIQKLAKENVELYGVHSDSSHIKSVEFKDIKICSFRDLKTILNYGKKERVEGVITDNCDYSLLAAAFVAGSLNIHGPSLKAAQISNNKFLQREITSQNGIKSPKYRLCLSQEEVTEFAEKAGFPIITKPVDSRGSFGVRKIESAKEIKEAYEYACINSNSNLVIAEEFIEGNQITIDGYGFPESGIRSLAAGDKILVEEDGEVATTIAYPSKLSKKTVKKAKDLNEKINQLFGYDYGMTHSEYMIRGEDIYLIESTNRGGGVFTSTVIAPYSCDIDLKAQLVYDTLGLKRDLYQKTKNKEVVLKFFRFSSGKVKQITGFKKLLKNPNVLAAQLWIKENDTITQITNDANRHGFIISKGDETEAQKLINSVTLSYVG